MKFLWSRILVAMQTLSCDFEIFFLSRVFNQQNNIMSHIKAETERELTAFFLTWSELQTIRKYVALYSALGIVVL